MLKKLMKNQKNDILSKIDVIHSREENTIRSLLMDIRMNSHYKGLGVAGAAYNDKGRLSFHTNKGLLSLTGGGGGALREGGGPWSLCYFCQLLRFHPLSSTFLDWSIIRILALSIYSMRSTPQC